MYIGNYYATLANLPLEGFPMNLILNAVERGIPEMELGKAYPLKKIVELGEPGLWKSFNPYELRCIGHTFAMFIGNQPSSILSIAENQNNPMKYIRNY